MIADVPRLEQDITVIKKDKTTAGYWSCFQWRAAKVDN